MTIGEFYTQAQFILAIVKTVWRSWKIITWSVLNVELLLKQLWKSINLNVELLLKQFWKSINLNSFNPFAFWMFQKIYLCKNLPNIFEISTAWCHPTPYQCFDPRFVPTLQTFSLSQNPHSKGNHVFVSFEFKREKPRLLFFQYRTRFFYFRKKSILFFLFEFKLHTPESAEQVITAYDQNFLWVHRYYLGQQSKFKNWLIFKLTLGFHWNLNSW